MDSSNVLITVMIIIIITLTLETIVPAFSLIVMITSFALPPYLCFMVVDLRRGMWLCAVHGGHDDNTCLDHATG